jgi:hypothetical protein
MEITQIVNPFPGPLYSGSNGSRIAVIIFILIAIVGFWYYYKSKTPTNTL